MNLDYNNPITLWVCVDCIMHAASGECGSCHSSQGHDREPLNKIDYRSSAMGLTQGEHECDDPENPNYECDCETVTFSLSQCQGCGSYLHGERHAMTEWLVKD